MFIYVYFLKNCNFICVSQKKAVLLQAVWKNKTLQNYIMRKILSILLLCVLAVTASAVPARRGWQTRTQADGSSIEIQQVGDEYYHYMINRAGKEVREINGMYVEIGEAPIPAVAQARRAKGVARRQRKDIGIEPNLAPKGVVILANFSDKAMRADHSLSVFDELFNAANCTVNSGYPSAAQYFADQSNGSYHPQFDVFGPVNLSRNVAYYGTDKPGSDEGDDQHATDAVVEACRLANEQFTINWADYDSNNDGYIDFVYVIHAGYGQADGGASTTIWPHNWEVSSARSSGYCTYTAAQCKVGGKTIENYAISAELDHYANTLNGIGTLCHEFGHVLGLPDWYDTSYGTNYSQSLTPNDWDVMDGGAYGGDGHCPPNYSPWEKYFFGWHTPINLGNTGANLTLYPNGTDNYQAYQINSSGTQQGPTTSGWCYFIENRQQVGWDRGLTASGMLIWKVNFNASKWQNNEPNNTANNPLYTIVSATGTKIGWDGSTDNCPKNVFPGTGNKTSWTGLSDKPLLNINHANGLITLTYIEAPVAPVDSFTLTFMANGREFATTTSTGTVVLPSTNPLDCPCGKVFLGWTKTANYESETTAPTYVKAGDPIAEATTLYAVYAEQSGEGGEAAFDGTTGGTFKIYAQVGNTKHYATGTVSNSKLQSTTDESEAADFVLTAVTGGGFSIATGGKYLSNGSKTNVSLSTTAQPWNMEIGTQGTWRVNSSANEGRALVFRAGDYNVFGAYATSNINGTEYFDLEIGGEGGASYSDYSTACGCWYTDMDSIESSSENEGRLVLRNGQLLIIRGDAIYSITGARLQ